MMELMKDEKSTKPAIKTWSVPGGALQRQTGGFFDPSGVYRPLFLLDEWLQTSCCGCIPRG